MPVFIFLSLSRLNLINKRKGILVPIAQNRGSKDRFWQFKLFVVEFFQIYRNWVLIRMDLWKKNGVGRKVVESTFRILFFLENLTSKTVGLIVKKFIWIF